ncbi:beta strand repeat-containing protein [Prosthecobacter sp.]|uniref:beta strand repeat-containing protein n=1 Tax=Prosthecobacter sp. TaxID=1965333 RepID=UPI0037848A15
MKTPPFSFAAATLALAGLLGAPFLQAAGFTISTSSTTPQTLSSGTGTVTETGTLTVTGNNVAVGFTGSSTLTNLGTIQQTSVITGSNAGKSRALRDNTGGITLTINNGSATNSTALIQTADADVIQMNVAGSTITFNNYGTLNSQNSSASGNQAIDWNALNTTTGSNTLNNFSTGVITASEADAVRPGVNGFINNAGLIKSTTSSGSSSDGVDLQSNNGATITNASNWSAGTPATPGTGTIEGGRHGITGGPSTDITFTASITNNLGGTIQGDNGSGINFDGFSSKQMATIVNNGLITGNGHNISDGVSHDGDGVDIDGMVNLTNTGTIRSINSFNIAADGVAHSEGITVGGGTITNSGTIEGLVAAGNTNAIGYGITLLGNDIAGGGREAMYADATITNQAGGLIRGDSASGIAMLGSTAGGHSVTINNNAGATIQGGATLSGLGGTMAAITTGKDAVTINNAGIINGSSNGYAITGDSGNITLNVTGGAASILGNITGGSGTNAMHIDPGAGNSFSYAGAISAFNSIEVKSGTVSLSGASSSYSGTTTLTGGQLNLNNAAAIGTGGLVINGGALDNTTGSALTLSTNNAITINSDFEFKGSNDLNLGTGAVTLNANHVVTVDAGKLTIGGTLTSSQYQLTKAGAGTLELSGSSNFTGPVNVSGGSLSTSNVDSLGTGTQVNLGSGTALQYTGGSATITQDITVTSGSGTIANTGGGTLTLSGTLNKDGTVLTLSGGVINANGAITGSSSGSDLVVDGATVNENAANSYNGPTYIRNGGTLNANVADALPTTNGRTSVILDDTGSGSSKLALGADQAAASLTGAASSTVDLGGHSLTVGASSGTTTYEGVIASSSGGVLVKDGGSTLELAGASTYSGGTQINDGTLSATNTSGSATGSGSVMVNAGGTLNGTGTVGSVSVASGGTLAPGLSIGTLNVDGTLDLVSGSHVDYSLGSLSSLLNVSGALNFTGPGAAIFDITDTGGMTSNTDYTLINYASESGLTLANLAFGSTPSVFSGHFVIGDNSLTLHVDAVPEPSRALLGALGLAFITLRRRRRVRAAVTA